LGHQPRQSVQIPEAAFRQPGGRRQPWQPQPLGRRQSNLEIDDGAHLLDTKGTHDWDVGGPQTGRQQAQQGRQGKRGQPGVWQTGHDTALAVVIPITSRAF
jgi:hypothetical protein